MDKNPLLVSGPLTVEDAWIDFNGHLNMAYYNVLFDRGIDGAYSSMGLGWDYARERRLTTYTAEFQIRYLRELHAGDEVMASFQLLDHDEKRLHTWQELRHRDGWLAATGEGVALHIDMAGPRVVPFPADIMARVTAVASAHAALPRPAGAGRPISLRKRAA